MLGELPEGLQIHAQGDNLTAIALVEATPLLPTGTAVRWGFRYALGIPPFGATLYRREHLPPTYLTIDFTKVGNFIAGGPVFDYELVELISQGNLNFNTTTGLALASVLIVQFFVPVRSVAVVGSGAANATLVMAACHAPAFDDANVTEQIIAQPVNGATTEAVSFDLIDTLFLAASAPMTIAALKVSTVSSAMANDWQRVGDIVMPAGAADTQCSASDTTQPFAGSETATSSVSQGLRDALMGLFDERVRDANGNVVPMGERMLPTQRTSSDDPSIVVPTLALLRLYALAPTTARQLGWLIDVSAAGADLPGVWDYLVVGQWCPRPPLAPLGNVIDLAAILSNGITVASNAASNVLMLGAITVEVLGAAPTVAANGVTLSGQVLLVALPRTAQVVELDCSGGGTLELTALAFVGVEGQSARGAPADEIFRIVDWACGRGGPRATVCADGIDAISIVGIGTTVTGLRWALADPAVAVGPSADVGQIGFFLFQAGDHPLPDAPTQVMVDQLTDEATGAHAPAAGISWTSASPTEGVQFGPVTYQVARGTQAGALNDVIAGDSGAPLVVAPATATASPPPTPIYVRDPVTNGATLVYGVIALDLFGRSSAMTSSAATTFSDTVPPPPPVGVRASVAAVGSSITVNWTWPPQTEKALTTLQGIPDPNPTATGFNVYGCAGSMTYSYQDGVVSAVAPNGSAQVTVTTSIPSSSFSDLASLTGRMARIGGDRYLVQNASTASSGGTPVLVLTIALNPSTPTLQPAVYDSLHVVGGAPAATYGAPQGVNNAAARTATVAGTWSPADARGISYASVGVSAVGSGGESAISGPVLVTRIVYQEPAQPVTPETVEATIWAGPSDPNGYASCRYTAAVTANCAYHVYRALDNALLAADAAIPRVNGVRQFSVAANGTVDVGLPLNFNPATSPLTQADFDAVTQSQPYASALSNTDLHALANLRGNESAFERITPAPVVAAAPNLTTVSGVTELQYTDATLPGSGNSRYVYRLRTISPSGALGSFLWASPPVTLRPAPPRRPTIAGIRGDGGAFTITWNPNSDRNLATYRIYGSIDPEASQDARSMEMLAEEPATSTSASVPALAGNRMWFRVTATASYPAPIGTLVSEPSDAASAMAPTFGPPPPPALSAITTTIQANSVSVSFAADGNPTTRYLLCRVGANGTSTVPVGSWTPSTGPGAAVTLSDDAPIAGAMSYVVRCTNETQAVSVTDVITASAPAGAGG